ncbi:MAG: glycosyltransferase [Deltaproteobacteria bacterium]|jgi:glycosyltransferase involved in cell wall biosynthesis|nr:glycosyltransferase [Deltaproteobacteria bacterium]MBW2499396.1 glycosyltransferase [Deltaproteobacteria bacterium]
MRVAQVIDGLRLGGGAEQLQVSFAEAVQNRPVDLSILTINRNHPSILEMLRDLGVEVRAFPADSFLSPIRAARFVRHVRQEGFDLLHTHLVRSTLLGGLAGRLCDVPVVSTIHNTQHDRKLPWLLRAAEGRILRRGVDRVVAVGWQTAAAHAAWLHPRTLDVIPNAVRPFDPAWVRGREELRHSLGASKCDRVLISVGRLHLQKGYGDLIEAFERLRGGRHPNLKLWIVGAGGLREALTQDVQRRGLGDAIRLLGLREDVPRLLAASDLYVSSAHWEGLPLSILEAMSAGLPVVATTVGDVPRIVDDRNGRLAPPADPLALAEALDTALADPARLASWGEEGRRRAHEEFGVEAWADRILRLYEDVLREHRRRRNPVAEPGRGGVTCGS